MQQDQNPHFALAPHAEQELCRFIAFEECCGGYTQYK